MDRQADDDDDEFESWFDIVVGQELSQSDDDC